MSEEKMKGGKRSNSVMEGCSDMEIYKSKSRLCCFTTSFHWNVCR